MLSRTFFACSCFFALRVCSGMRTVFLQLVPESSILVRQVSAGSSSALEAFHFDGWSRTSIHYSYASGCQEKFWAEVKLCWRLCCRIVLKKSLTAGGASVASLERRPPRRMVMRHGGGRGAEAMSRGAEPLGGGAAQRRKRASRGYMVPFCPCGTRAAFAATFVAAQVGAKPHAPHRAVNIVLQQSHLCTFIDKSKNSYIDKN